MAQLIMNKIKELEKRMTSLETYTTAHVIRKADNRITAKDAAHMIGFTQKLLLHRKKDAGMPPYYKISNRVYYDYEELRNWINEHKHFPAKK